jgi:uncharacterized membrane protein
VINQAIATSDDGSVIVGYALTSGLDTAMVWAREGGPQTLAGYLSSQGVQAPSGWNLIKATSISADGRTIAGYAQRGNEFQGFVVTIPAPSTFVVVGVGLFCLARRRGR